MTEPILLLLLGLVFAVVMVIGGISHMQQQKKSSERQNYLRLKHQADTIQEALRQITNVDPLPELHLYLTDYLLTCLTKLRNLGMNVKSVDAQITDARKRRELIQKGSIKFPGMAPVSDLGQVKKIKKLYQRVAVILKKAASQGLLNIERYNRLIAHVNWQKLKVETESYETKAAIALKTQDITIAKRNLYHVRRMLANSKVNHPGRKEKFLRINEQLGSIQKQENVLIEPIKKEEKSSSDQLENMTFMTDFTQKKRSF